jgi:hypothetical protein
MVVAELRTSVHEGIYSAIWLRPTRVRVRRPRTRLGAQNQCPRSSRTRPANDRETSRNDGNGWSIESGLAYEIPPVGSPHGRQFPGPAGGDSESASRGHKGR